MIQTERKNYLKIKKSTAKRKEAASEPFLNLTENLHAKYQAQDQSLHHELF